MTTLDTVLRGDAISASQHNRVLQLLRRRVTGPMVVETAEGWHIRRDPSAKQVVMARLTSFELVGEVFYYGWESVTLDPSGAIIAVPGGETGDVVRDFAINLADIITPPLDPLILGTVVQLVAERKNVGQHFRTFVVGDGGGVTGTGAPSSRLVKMTQIVNDVARCVEVKKLAVVVSAGNNGFVVAGAVTFFDIGATFIADGVQVGFALTVLNGASAGEYVVVEVQLETVLLINTEFDEAEENLSYEIVEPGENWGPDYSRVFEAELAPTGPTHRFLPYLGPDDHFGNDLQTFAGSEFVISSGANFLSPSNLVDVDMYIEIFSGVDAGRHRIVVVGATILTLSRSMTASAVDLTYRIDIVSEHATTLHLITSSGGDHTVTPDQNSLEVKIARAIRDQADAINFDISREMNNTDALDFFNEVGPYLACYRLQVGASESQGLPVDDRVIIIALPWRGHAVSGVLYFDAQNPAQPKYDLSAADEPVWPIRWLRDHWRLEGAIAEDELQEPTVGQVCP